MDKHNPMWKDLETYIFPREFFLSHVFNACLYHHPEENTRRLLDTNGVYFHFHLDSFYFCLTGINKEMYHHHYGLDAASYVRVFSKIRDEIIHLCAVHSWLCDVFLVWKEEEKQIAILLSPDNDALLSIEDIVKEIDSLVQNQYEIHIFKGDSQYRNVTTLSTLLHGFDAIRTGYLQVRTLSKLSYLHMDGRILTNQVVSENKNTADYSLILDACFTLRSYIDEGDARQAERHLTRLFLNTIRGSYSLALCDDALSFIKSMLQVRCKVYGVTSETPLETLCARTSYHKVEECVEALLPVIHALCAAVQKQGAFSKPVLSAIYYIKMHFAGYLVLTDVARYANTNASYLSSKFKEETSYSVRNYINKIRLETAQELLLSSSDTVAAIAQQVGFEDVRYFTRVFKQFASCTPTEYRQKNKQA